MDCPSPESLARFLRGELSATGAVPFQVHLETCARCFAQLALGAAGMSDSFAVDPEWFEARATELSDTPPSASGAHGAVARSELLHYQLEREVGRGGMGVVYSARDTRNGAVVALKMVRNPSPGAVESMRREIRFLSEARHPGLVAVVDHDLTQGDPWYAMELLEGETLTDRNATWWGSEGALPQRAGLPRAGGGHLDDILALFRQLCEPLDFIHRAGIVHCDLKPANVFLRRGGELVLMDFGLAVSARGAVGREALALASRGRGTLPYMCPEVILGKIPDARADLYAVGCMLYESITGRPPFLARRDEIFEQHLSAPVVPASSRVSELPPKLDDLLLALLAKDPNERLGDAMQLAAELDELRARPSSLSPRALLYRPELVGRDADQAIVEEAAQRAVRGQGSLLLLAGESGIGKTFFVSEASQRALLRGMRVVLAECEPFHQSEHEAVRTLHAFSGLFELLRDECRRGGPDTILRLLGEAPNVLSVYSPALAALPELRNLPAPVPLPDAAGRARVLSSLRTALIELARERPLLLVVDDLQWADELSFAFLESLTSEYLESAPILVIGTYRSDELSPALQRLVDRPDVSRRQLTRLERPALASMVGHMLGTRVPPLDLVEFVNAESEGVPFFVAEYLRSALSEGALTFSAGAWQLASIVAARSSLPFPARLQQLVRRRVASLSPAAQAWLQVAAVMGRDVDVQLVTAAHNDTTDPASLLSEALDRGVVGKSGEGYRFSHDKFREVIYADIGDATRRSLHGAVARAIESMCPPDSAEHEHQLGALARHFKHGGEPERALTYFQKAGTRALRISADAEALALLTEALEVEAMLPTRSPVLARASWERGIADALVGLGRIAESEQHLRRAAALLGRPLASTDFGAFLSFGRELGRRVLRRFARRRNTPVEPLTATALEAGRVLERFHRTAYFTGRALDIFLGSVASLNVWETALPGPELLSAYANAAQLCGVLPAHGWARSYLVKANDIHAVAPDLTAETLLRLVEGVYYMGIGASADAIRQVERGVLVAEQIGFHRRREECLAVRAGIDFFAGRWSSAAPYTARLEASARARGDKQMLAWSLCQKLDGYLLRGALTDSPAAIAELTTLSPALNAPDRLWALGPSALAMFRLGRLDEAERLALQAAELARKIPPVYTYCISAYDKLIDACLGLSDHQLRERGAVDPRLLLASKTAIGALARSARTFPIARPMLLLHEGNAQARRGRASRAIGGWRRGLEQASAMQLVHHEARLSQALANTLPSGAEQERYAQRVRTALASLDLHPASIEDGRRESVAPQLAM